MRLSSIFLLGISFGSASAQYFSAGWSPGQPIDQTPPSDTWPSGPPGPANTQTEPSSGALGWGRLLASGPIGSLLNSAGINITKNMEEAAKREANRWDKRIPMITDDNYNDIIVNESLTEEDEKDRVWILLITLARAQAGGFSDVVDAMFDAAYNLTVAENDLDNVRWGRVDYLDVTALTTKWAVWQGPLFMIITDRGRSLRFFKPNQLYAGEQTIRNWLKDEQWKEHNPWSSKYAPGGSREWVLDSLAFVAAKSYNLVSRVPKWLFLIISGSVGSFVLGLFHKTPQGASQQQRVVNKLPPRPPTVQSPPGPPPIPHTKSSSPSKPKTGVKQRKGKH